MISDEQLILYYYRDGLSKQHLEEISMALEQDAQLAERFSMLSSQLGRLEADDEVAAPAPAMRRWHNSLDQLVVSEQRKPSPLAWLWQSFQSGFAVAAAAVLVLAVGITIGLNLPDGLNNPNQGFEAAESTDSFASGLRVFLQETEMQLAGLDYDNTAQRQALITEIISRNRMYQLAAQNSSDPGLARVLRAFELVLVSMVNEQSSDADIEAARAQLVFELTAMQTKLAHVSSKQVPQL